MEASGGLPLFRWSRTNITALLRERAARTISYFPSPKIDRTEVLPLVNEVPRSDKQSLGAIHLAEVVGAQLTLLHFYDEHWRQVNPTGPRGYEAMLEEERIVKNRLYALRDENSSPASAPSIRLEPTAP